MTSKKIKEKITVRSIVCEVFDRLPVNQDFNGIELKKWCVRIEPSFRAKYDETFLRLLRMYRREKFICIDRAKSKYRKVA